MLFNSAKLFGRASFARYTLATFLMVGGMLHAGGLGSDPVPAAVSDADSLHARRLLEQRTLLSNLRKLQVQRERQQAVYPAHVPPASEPGVDIFKVTEATALNLERARIEALVGQALADVPPQVLAAANARIPSGQASAVAVADLGVSITEWGFRLSLNCLPSEGEGRAAVLEECLGSQIQLAQSANAVSTIAIQKLVEIWGPGPA